MSDVQKFEESEGERERERVRARRMRGMEGAAGERSVVKKKEKPGASERGKGAKGEKHGSANRLSQH